MNAFKSSMKRKKTLNLVHKTNNMLYSREKYKTKLKKKAVQEE